MTNTTMVTTYPTIIAMERERNGQKKQVELWQQ